MNFNDVDICLVGYMVNSKLNTRFLTEARMCMVFVYCMALFDFESKSIATSAYEFSAKKIQCRFEIGISVTFIRKITLFILRIYRKSVFITFEHQITRTAWHRLHFISLFINYL